MLVIIGPYTEEAGSSCHAIGAVWLAGSSRYKVSMGDLGVLVCIFPLNVCTCEKGSSRSADLRQSSTSST